MACLKNFVYACVIALAAIMPGCAQRAQPVSWYFESVQLTDTEFRLFFTLNAGDGWHIYSQYTKAPMQTKFEFDPSAEFELAGKLEESPNSLERFDPIMRTQLKWFERSAWFAQLIKLKVPAAVVKGRIIFTPSNNIEYLPGEVINFSIAVRAKDVEKKDTLPAYVTTPAVTEPKESLPQDRISETSIPSLTGYPIAPVWLVALGAVLGGFAVWLAQRIMAKVFQTPGLSGSHHGMKNDLP